MSSETLKNRKDAFISALAALRKAGNDVSDAAIGFIAAIESHGILSNQDTAEVSKFSVAFSNAKAASESTKPLVEDQDKPKRKKRVTDPNQPKRPLPVVLEYLNAEKKRIRERLAADNQNPPDIAELNSMAQKAWTELAESEKASLTSLHEERVAKYQKELAEYKTKKAADESEAKTENVDAEESKPVTLTEVSKESDDAPKPTPKKRKTKDPKDPKDPKDKDGSPEKKKRKSKKKDAKDAEGE